MNGRMFDVGFTIHFLIDETNSRANLVLFIPSGGKKTDGAKEVSYISIDWYS